MRPLTARGSSGLPLPSARWLAELLLRLEHAFERAHADDRAENDTRVRIFMVTVGFALLFAVLAAGATRAALFSGHAAPGVARAAPALLRADVTDRDGRLLATNLTHYRLFIDPAEVWDRPAATRALTAALPRLPRRRLAEVMAGGSRAFVAGGLTPQERARLHDLALGGVYFEPEDRRVYPLGPTAAHLVGFADTAGEGLAGAERAFSDQIRSGGAEGAPFALSIDLRVQGALEMELAAVAAEQQARGAVGVVTNVHTGEVLAMASWPEFDPNAAGTAGADALRNRAAADVYEMGSIAKVFSVAAALDSGAVRADTVIDTAAPLRIGGRTIRDFHAQNRPMTVEEVFLHSSNIGTSHLAARMGAEVMVPYYEAFGLLRAAPIELAESARPLVPARWDGNTLASASFGHAIGLTPLQMAAGIGAIMNGGEYVPLTIRPVRPGRRPRGRRVVSEETSRRMLALMRLNAVRGSGTRAEAQAPGLRLGGKTGSAEKYTNGRPDRTRVLSSFAAVFPADGPPAAPRYLVMILVDEPRGAPSSYGLRTGGFVAAPAVGRVANRIAPFLGVERRDDPFRTAAGARMPLPEDASQERL